MSDSRIAGGLDRLPWLSDEPAPKRAPPVKRGALDLVGWASAAVLLVAGASFWLGTRSHEPQIANRVTAPKNSTVAVPQQRSAPAPEVRIAPPPQVAPALAREVRLAPAREVRIAPPARRNVRHEDTKTAATESQAAKTEPVESGKIAAPAQARTPPAPVQLIPWPPRVTAGAFGRLVQIGAYGSRIQAKRGWVKMVHAYPAVAHLPAIVVGTRNSRGRLFYRFQIGTTSQAHSEVLCQRLHKIDLSCAIVGLPWKSKIER